MARVLAINGSYRAGGITDQTLETMSAVLESCGYHVNVIHLRDNPIGFCLNCRACTQEPGESPGNCVLDDGMQSLIDKIETSDRFIFASPTNFDSSTALFKRFLERLVVYAYWPWEMNAPQFRKAGAPKKKALVVSSSAAPAIMGRFLFHTTRQLKYAARTIGAETVGTLFTGLVAKDPNPDLPVKTVRRARALAKALAT